MKEDGLQIISWLDFSLREQAKGIHNNKLTTTRRLRGERRAFINVPGEGKEYEKPINTGTLN